MEEAIAAGRVTVNGETAQIGQSASPGDRIKVNGKLVNLRFANRLPRVIIYHKPEGEIVSRDDPEHRPSVFTSLPRLSGGRWVAGRAAQARRQKLTAIRGESVGKRLTKGLNLPQ